jgi:predicted ATPase
VHAAVREHLGRLPAALRELLEIASVLGRDFTAAALSKVSVRPASEVTGALAEAAELGVLVERDAHDFAFSHGILAETLHRDLPAARRASLHLAIADGIARDPAEIARHLFEAGPEHGERATRAAALAAEDACGRMAFEVAGALARRALAVISPDDRPLRFE